MSQATKSRWERKRSKESRHVEEILRNAGLDQADAYRYNLASIRVRVIDPRFEELKREERFAMVEPHLEQLPERTQADIISLFAFAPSEIQEPSSDMSEFLNNVEFDHPTPSRL